MFKDNLRDKINIVRYVINPDEYSDIGTHWIALNALNNSVTYFDSLEAPKEIKKLIDKYTIVINIFRMQAYDLVMCGYFCIQFIDIMLKSKSFTDFINPFSPNNFEKNYDIILN